MVMCWHSDLLILFLPVVWIKGQIRALFSSRDPFYPLSLSFHFWNVLRLSEVTLQDKKNGAVCNQIQRRKTQENLFRMLLHLIWHR